MVRKHSQSRALALPTTQNQMVLALYAALTAAVVLGTGLNWLLT
ncbi:MULTISPECIES: hypothetical protein [Acetobacter]|jgi:hypothetical protein|uniref:Uncharacterized protein n=1 Tax=Acetobacter lovaniensis TaxID=104100 RepID=A0A841QFQ0_9PROT|nr:hypothetical protein [Acetobacter lovaniensis]MBB6456887.1 hypothetical protein [Acetobacter lovaniensis]GBQ69923.1 hypothetical protein AA0474_2058 [Acetobacter lovaniensis NRIC 0474]